MEFNKDDSWVVLSPRRTGSLLLATYIHNVYIKKGVSLKWTDNLDNEPKGIIGHVHDENCNFFESVNYILSYRTITESVLSHFISKEIKKNYFREKEVNEFIITPFYLDVELFLINYNSVLSWYKIISQRNLKFKAVINYADIQDNALDQIPHFLNFPLINSKTLTSYVKTPGTHSEWISNWEEIKPWIDTLSYMNNYCYQNYIKPLTIH